MQHLTLWKIRPSELLRYSVEGKAILIVFLIPCDLHNHIRIASKNKQMWLRFNWGGQFFTDHSESCRHIPTLWLNLPLPNWNWPPPINQLKLYLINLLIKAYSSGKVVIVWVMSLKCYSRYEQLCSKKQSTPSPKCFDYSMAFFLKMSCRKRSASICQNLTYRFRKSHSEARSTSSCLRLVLEFGRWIHSSPQLCSSSRVWFFKAARGVAYQIPINFFKFFKWEQGHPNLWDCIEYPCPRAQTNYTFTIIVLIL